MRVQDGRTPLHIAAFWNHAPCLKLLLGNDANVDLADKVGELQVVDT